MTTAEANDILNAFMGWKPKHHNWHDYFADTPEAREAVRLLKDEFASCIGANVDVHTRAVKGKPPLFGAWAGHEPQKTYGCASIESHAIALAILRNI